MRRRKEVVAGGEGKKNTREHPSCGAHASRCNDREFGFISLYPIAMRRVGIRPKSVVLLYC